MMIAAFLYMVSYLAIVSNGVRESTNYYLVEQLVTRDVGASHCQSAYGTKLASVHCDEQNQEIVDLIDASAQDRAYIGAKSNRNTFDDGSVKDWTWTVGGGQQYSGDCCNVEIIAGQYRFWNDLGTHNRYFVCNKVPVLDTCAINECEKGLHDCDENADCIDEREGFRCECRAGFTGDGEQCSDVDECGESNGNGNDCDVNAECINTFGGYDCSCNPGYTDISGGGDGTECEDIDECANPKANSCDINAQCSNTGGSYTCTCNEGYTGDGQECGDIDECESGANDCALRARNAHCKNIGGGYECECVNDMRVEITCGVGEEKRCTSNVVDNSWDCACEQTNANVFVVTYPWAALFAGILIVSLLWHMKFSFGKANQGKGYKSVQYVDSDSEAQAINVA